MNNNGLKYVIIFILILMIILFIKTSSGEVVYIESDIDNNKYLVRDLEDKEKASNMLAKIKENLFYLNDTLIKKKQNYPEFIEYIDQLNRKIKNIVISESSANSIYTSYSVNKGEKIVFCLRSKHNYNKLHDLNLVMYVALHEISHVACPEYGHTDLFKKIFAFFTEIAIELNIYEKIFFEENPKEYCGLIITDSII